MTVIRIRKPLTDGATWVSRSTAASKSYPTLARARHAVAVL